MKRLFLISVFFVAALVVVAGSLFVDDDAPNDPAPGNPLIGDAAGGTTTNFCRTRMVVCKTA